MRKLVLVLAVCAGVASAQVPSLINYQGRLVNGTNLVNDTVGLTLQLYDDTAAGTLLYEDSNQVAVVDGLYSTFIGDDTISGTLTGALAAAEVWIQVLVNGAPLTPREQLVSAAYALRSGDVPGNVFWRTDGNTGTSEDDDFVGTRDNEALSFRVNNQQALRLIPAADTPQIMGGHSNNVIGWSSPGAVIAGGGLEGQPNRIFGNASYGAIGGGSGNVMGDGAIFTTHAVIGGGQSNNATATATTVGGGLGNRAYGVQATVGGGENNTAYGSYATVAGGRRNTASNNYAAIGGGFDNRATGRASAVGGGQLGQTLAEDSVIAGGYYNRINSGAARAVIAGGVSNQIDGGNSTIAGGLQNRIVGWSSLIAGGAFNIASNNYSAVLGGYNNQAVGYNTLAAGWMARAAHDGSFVWADPDSVFGYFSTTSTNQFLIRARGGVGINTNGPFTDALTVNGGIRASEAVHAESFVGDGSGLTMLNGTNLIDGSVSNAALATETVTSDKIKNGTITANDVAANTFWSTEGNTGTEVGDFLGTTDTQPLQLGANYQRVARYEGGGAVPNVIGGHMANTVDVGVVGATIGGGGDGTGTFPQRVTDNYGTVGGGQGNRAGNSGGTVSDAEFATVAGGQINAANALHSFVGGGYYNSIGIGARGSVIAGGSNNAVNGYGSVVAGGTDNSVQPQASVIGGGASNMIGSDAYSSVIVGGFRNMILTHRAFIGGGQHNYSTGQLAVVVGGFANTNTGLGAFIGAGYRNLATSAYDVVVGGLLNKALGSYSAVGGGRYNEASGWGSVAGGGDSNRALGAYSVVDGGTNNLASANMSVIGGGSDNSILYGAGSVIGGGSRNTVTGDLTVVAGGAANTVIADSSFIGGGSTNTIGTNAHWSVIGGGKYNSIEAGADRSVIGGGMYNVMGGQYYGFIGGGYTNAIHGDYGVLGGGSENYIADNANYSVIGGGWGNIMTNQYAHGSFIGGGYFNTVSGRWSVVTGGDRNKMGGEWAVIGGGMSNVVNGDCAVVPGGRENIASAPYSFAAGRRASAVHTGAFVWADSSTNRFSSTTNDQFAIRASNGVWIAQNRGTGQTAGFGERFRDNGIIAWARITSAGTVSANYNITQCVHSAEGAYQIDIGATADSMLSLVPVAVAEVDSQPLTAGNMRLVSVNQNSGYRFDVWINNGSFAPTNSDFVFIVTGR